MAVLQKQPEEERLPQSVGAPASGTAARWRSCRRAVRRPTVSRRGTAPANQIAAAAAAAAAAASAAAAAAADSGGVTVGKQGWLTKFSKGRLTANWNLG